MVSAVHEHYDGRSSRYIEIPHAVVPESHAVDHPKRRVEAECLQSHLSGKLEPRYIAKTQRHHPTRNGIPANSFKASGCMLKR